MKRDDAILRVLRRHGAINVPGTAIQLLSFLAKCKTPFDPYEVQAYAEKRWSDAQIAEVLQTTTYYVRKAREILLIESKFVMEAPRAHKKDLLDEVDIKILHLRDEEELKWFTVGNEMGMSSEGARQRYLKAKKILGEEPT